MGFLLLFKRLLPFNFASRLASFMAFFVWSFHWCVEAWKLRKTVGGANLTLRGSERAEIAESLFGLYPFSNLLEVGCGFGQNFHVLAPIFPDVEMVGVDIDPMCVVGGQEEIDKMGYSNVKLFERDAAVLADFPNASFDVLISVASLLYVGPQSIVAVVCEMLRVTRRAIILVEQHEDRGGDQQGELGTPLMTPKGMIYWLRDYRGLFSRFVNSACIEVKKIPSPLWNTERWMTLGHLIEIRFDL